MEAGNQSLVMNGTIVEELPSYRGKTKDGKDFEKRTYILEVHNTRKEKLKFDMCSFDGPVLNPLKVGNDYKIELDCRSTKYNGNWFTNLSLIRVTDADF